MEIWPGVGLLDHIVALFLVFKETFILFSIVAVPVYISTSSLRGFPFLHSLSNIIVCSFFFFDDGHSNWCEVIPNCSLDLHFS